MKNVIILGAAGNIAKHVIEILSKKDGVNLTLFLPEKGSVISRKSLAKLITEITESPEKYARENPGVNKPNS